MKQEKEIKRRPAAVIVLCFCLTAIVSVMIVKTNIDKVRDNMEGANVAEVIQEKEVSGTEAPAVVDSIDNPTAKEPAPRFIMPADGEIITEHSMDQVVYWETLDQYMTHSGIDIAVPEGTSVKACSAGTITRIEEDDRFGMVCEINHGGGLVSLYGNLAGELSVEVGDVVECGDVIAKAGHTSLFEYDSPSHVHFEMTLNGDAVDPGDYV